MVESSTIQVNDSFTSLGTIRVRDRDYVMSAQKKVYGLLLNLSYGSYKATLMASLFSELTKFLIGQEKNLRIQLGAQTNEPPQFIIQFYLNQRVDITKVNGLDTVFDYVNSETSDGLNNCIELRKNLVDHQIISDKEFIEETIRTIEIRSQEELYEELQESNEDLNDSLKKFEELNEELEAFSYSVSHDLRAPLRHMVGFAELLKKHIASEDEKTNRYLNNILESSKRMGQLIDDLLSFSRTGRAPVEPRELDLGEIVTAVKAELASTMVGRSIKWVIHDLPNAVGDRTLIRLVYQNLISNAIKYSGNTAKAVIEVGSFIQDEDVTVYFVKDNGAGFDMKYSDKLFGVFSRLHRVDEFEGTGIGLANVRRIIHKHEGNVWAEAEEGKGATFYFTLFNLTKPK